MEKDKYTSFYVIFYFPTYEIIPDAALAPTVTDTYTSDTRPTTIIGDYGIINEDGTVTVIKDSTIIDETNNVYYNPVTGDTSNITNWTYDYSDRSYNVTTDNSSTVTITYGDENVTIQEGDTIYNIYYVMDGAGTGDPACEHDWQAGTKTDPTCNQPGRQPYTCSKCGAEKSDTLPALGHDWQVKKTVATQYSDSGELLQEGYTIYECSRCGEQYKTGNNTGPPSSGGGSSGGSGSDPPEEGGSVWDKLAQLLGGTISGIVELVGAVTGKLLEALTALSKTILDGLTVVVDTILGIFEEVPRLFSGFTAFLAAVFPFLPTEMVTLLTFGLAAIVFVGVVKSFRR